MENFVLGNKDFAPRFGLTSGSSGGTFNADNIIFGGLAGGRTLTATGNKDVFQYNTSVDFTNGDQIANFTPGTDKVTFTNLSRSSPFSKALKGRRTGKLLTTVNKSSKVAKNKTLLVYNSRSGELFYNANGSKGGFGSGGGLIADFSPNVKLSNNDFLFSYTDPLA